MSNFIMFHGGKDIAEIGTKKRHVRNIQILYNFFVTRGTSMLCYLKIIYGHDFIFMHNNKV
jgi:hypothetical protein